MALIFCGWLGDKIGQRLLVSMGGLVVAILGMVLIVALPLENNSGRLAGYYLTQASPTPFVALLSLIATNVAGYTKKTTVAAIYLICYCVGNIIGQFPYCVPGRIGTSSLGIFSGVSNTNFAIQNRASNFPPKGCPEIRTCRNHHHCVLGCLPDRLGFHLVVLQAHECEEGGH